jgi:beta-N-acetylhexosaminidase
VVRTTNLLSRRRLIAALATGVAMHSSGSARAFQTELETYVAAMPLAECAARMFMLPVSGTSLSAYDEAWLRAVKPGGVNLTGNNFGTPDEVKAFVAAIHATNPDSPPLVALDQEGGIVSRIADDPAPDAPTLGTLAPAEISKLARQRAETLARYGFDVNFAPVADVAFAPDSFMGGRAFDSDASAVAEDVSAYLGGVAGSGVLHCVKHFPGHGRVSIDSHEALPTLDVDEQTWWQAEALPFQAAVELGVPMIMLGHLVAPMWDDLPETLSPVAVSVLRDKLGFTGVTVSDDLLMGALTEWDAFDIVDLAVSAGIDLLLYNGLPEAPEALVAHLAGRVESGDVPLERVTTSVNRLLLTQARINQPA